jgi:hypothetical protein
MQRLGGMMARKKKIATFALVACLALSGIVFGFACSSGAPPWENCPKGLVNDPYPGACRRYVDTDSDGICDLSQPRSTDTTTTSLAVTTATSCEPPTGDCPLGPCAGCGACMSISAAVSTVSTAPVTEAVALAAPTGSVTTSTALPPSGGSDDSSVATAPATGAYNVSPIAVGFFLIYAVSFALYKAKRIKITTHRKIWNVLLLATFLITGIFGLILTIQLDYELPFTTIDLLFWHVEAGVVMTLISLFHVGWHLRYYRNLLRRRSGKVRSARAAERAHCAEDRRN